MTSKLKIRHTPLSSLKEDPQNVRLHPERNMVAIRDSLKRFGQRLPLVVRDGIVIVGNGRLRAMREMGWDNAAVVDAGDMTAEEARAFAVYDNRSAELATWDMEGLQATLSELDGLEMDLDLSAIALSQEDLDGLLDDIGGGNGNTADRYTDPPTHMSDSFGAPPFSVMDARQGYWMDRKREWFALGIDGDAGRPLVSEGKHDIYEGVNSGISVMDPVVCELLYAWFCPPGGKVINPMAGESVYGIVAAVMGYPYFGVEIRQEQIDTNIKQAKAILAPVPPKWILGDGRDVYKLTPRADLIICCPPYFDLEVYSDDDQDLSTCDTYDGFIEAYSQIIHACAKTLKQHRFAAFIVGDIRGKDGNYRGFVADTIRLAEEAGLALYNDAILLTPIGTLPFRTKRPFLSSRKLGKAHQNILVFLKGDAKKATAACGEVTRAELGSE